MNQSIISLHGAIAQMEAENPHSAIAEKMRKILSSMLQDESQIVRCKSCDRAVVKDEAVACEECQVAQAESQEER